MPFTTIKQIGIKGIAVCLPEKSENIEHKRNISNVSEDLKGSNHSKPVANELQTASDLGFIAAQRLFTRLDIDVSQIGAILFVSRTPDYRSPATSTVLHNRLGLSVDCIAYDINMGGAGFIYGLQVGGSILSSLNRKYAVVIIGDTANKQISPALSGRGKFGDASTAILLESNSEAPEINILTGSIGSAYQSVMHREGGFRINTTDNLTNRHNLSITNHLEIDEKLFHDVVIRNIPGAVKSFLENYNRKYSDYDLIAIQQEDIKLIKELVKGMEIPDEKVYSNFDQYGNCSGSSIPLLIIDYYKNNFSQTKNILAVGFGEGFSWGIAEFVLSADLHCSLIESSDYFRDGSVGHEI